MCCLQLLLSHCQLIGIINARIIHSQITILFKSTESYNSLETVSLHLEAPANLAGDTDFLMFVFHTLHLLLLHPANSAKTPSCPWLAGVLVGS